MISWGRHVTILHYTKLTYLKDVTSETYRAIYLYYNGSDVMSSEVCTGNLLVCWWQEIKCTNASVLQWHVVHTDFREKPSTDFRGTGIHTYTDFIYAFHSQNDEVKFWNGRDCGCGLSEYVTTLWGQRAACTRVYPKVSGLIAWSENCKWYSSLPLDAVVSLFCESVSWILLP
jgi:hypothetical protein